MQHLGKNSMMRDHALAEPLVHRTQAVLTLCPEGVHELGLTGCEFYHTGEQEKKARRLLHMLCLPVKRS